MTHIPGDSGPWRGHRVRGPDVPSEGESAKPELGCPALGALVVIAAEVISTRNLLNVVLCQALF